MDIVRLRTLRALADRGTIIATAAALHRTPSAVSQQIKSLSAELGVALTEPAGRGIRLTDAGKALVRHADVVIAAAEQAEAELDIYRRNPRGRVRVALFPSGALLLLAGLLRRMAAISGPVVECRDMDMGYHEVPDLVADYDLVVAHRDEHAAPLDDERLEIVHLLREPLDVALPPGHHLANHRQVELAQLVGERWIGVNVGMPVDDVLRSLVTRTGVPPQIVQRINDFKIIEELVADGFGVALLPRYTTDDRDGQRLLRRPLVGIRAARHVEVVLRRGSAERPDIATVLEALRAETAAVTAKT